MRSFFQKPTRNIKSNSSEEMMSVIFGVVEGTLSIEFGKIHPYFRCGQSKTTVAATGDFIQEVLGIFEEYISRLRLALNDKLWTRM